MLRDVRLRLLPNVLDCLRWSPDGQLAVSASEDVIILVPKNGNTSGKRSHQFHHARANLRELMVNSMNDEIPPADAEIYSIGDEQGPGYAKQLAWSPLGTSKYRRCILAVLATNHQIRIFEPKNHPWSDWHLKHDLTLDIFDYEGWMSASSDETTSRLRSRTRAISWSPACHLFAARRCGESLIAAANENFEIVFFRVTHDYHSIVGHFTAVGGPELQVGAGIQATWVNNLTWSLWRRAQPEGKNEAFLAYSFRGSVFMSRVTIGLDVDKEGNPSVNVSVGEKTLVGKSMSDVHPVFAIAWADEEFNGLSILAYAVSKCIMIAAINADGEIVSTREFVNEFIEPITGLCFTPSTNSSGVVLHAITVNGQSQTVVYSPLSAALHDHNNISTCHTSGDIDQTDIQIPDFYPEDKEEEALRAMATRWTNAISLRKQDFVNEYELSAATCRVYGIAPSPLGGVIAAACSFHPNDSLEYITASKESTRIVFGTHEGSEGVWKARGFLAGEEIDLSKVPNPMARASEALLLEAETLGDNRESVLRNIRKSLDRFKGTCWGLESVSISPEAVENSLSANILLQPSLNALRYRSCLEIVPDINNFGLPLVPRENAEIVAHHINSILRAPRDETTAKSMLSKRILYSVACIGILGLYNCRPVLEAARDTLSWLSGVDETLTDNAGDAERTIIDVATELQIVDRRMADLDVIERGDDDGSGLAMIREKDKLFTSKFERCTLCKKGMVWEDLRVAECEGNHRFSRCALTFLPIKEPKLTKECTICSRTVLGDAVLEGDKIEMRARGHEGERTLAQTILTGLDICVHCGGRYWAKGS